MMNVQFFLFSAEFSLHAALGQVRCCANKECRMRHARTGSSPRCRERCPLLVATEMSAIPLSMSGYERDLQRETIAGQQQDRSHTQTLESV